MSFKDISGTAIILTEDNYHSVFAKTAHGLVRGSDRFQIMAVVDKSHAGNDAGSLLDGKMRNIPITSTLEDAIQKTGKPDYCIIGIATAGGILPESLRKSIVNAISKGISIVCGLHQLMIDIPELKHASELYDVQLIDIRKPRPTSELAFWTGEILNLSTPRIAVLGVDCAVGKRTTCGLLHQLCLENDISSAMVYTGQTGWLQGYKSGFIFDSTANDFISGEVEKAILNCNEQEKPDLILIEGQSSLRNPSGPCGSEFLLSGDIKHIVLQHVPFRKEYEIAEGLHYPMPSIESEVELIKMYGAKTIAITLNGEGGTEEQLVEYQKMLALKMDIPVIRPLQEGLNSLLPELQRILNHSEN